MNIDFKMINILVSIIFCVVLGLIYLAMNFIGNKRTSFFNFRGELKRVAKNEKVKPIKDTTGYTLIGYNYKKPVYTTDNAKHVFICGTTGSGKTVALANYIKQACENNYQTLIIDGKGDIAEDSILEITKKFSNRKTYIINLSEPATSDKYNPFFKTNPTVAKDMLINLSDWSEEHYKLNTERYLQRVIMLMTKCEIALSFASIVKYIPINQFSKLSNDATKQEVISKEEHVSNLELAKISGKIAESATARFSLLLESELGTIFDDDGIDIATALKEKATIIFILNPLLYPETSTLMGRLILIDSKKAVSGLFKKSHRSFFIFDEIGSYASSVFIDLINKSRSAGVTCILATQSLSDLDKAVDENFREQIIECSNNYILLRQNSAKNSEAWANIIGTKNSVDTTYQLDQRDGTTTATGVGSVRFNKTYVFHPDEIKNLKTGEAFFVSKDTYIKKKITINKPF